MCLNFDEETPRTFSLTQYLIDDNVCLASFCGIEFGQFVTRVSLARR